MAYKWTWISTTTSSRTRTATLFSPQRSICQAWPPALRHTKSPPASTYSQGALSLPAARSLIEPYRGCRTVRARAFYLRLSQYATVGLCGREAMLSLLGHDDGCERDEVAAAGFIEIRDVGRFTTIADMMSAYSCITAAVAGGELTPSEGQAMAALLDIRRRALEGVEFEQRLKALEERMTHPEAADAVRAFEQARASRGRSAGRTRSHRGMADVDDLRVVAHPRGVLDGALAASRGRPLGHDGERSPGQGPWTKRPRPSSTRARRAERRTP